MGNWDRIVLQGMGLRRIGWNRSGMIGLHGIAWEGIRVEGLEGCVQHRLFYEEMSGRPESPPQRLTN